MLSPLPSLTLSDWRDLATIAGVFIALCTLVKGVLEYALQGKQRRAERFLALRAQLDAEEDFSAIITALDDDVAHLKTIPAADKRYFLALFEQVALMMNSGLIPKAVAHYMFGYYAIKAWDTAEFWHGMQDERTDPYWSLFAAFVEAMRKQETILLRTHKSPRTLEKLLKL